MGQPEKYPGVLMFYPRETQVCPVLSEEYPGLPRFIHWVFRVARFIRSVSRYAPILFKGYSEWPHFIQWVFRVAVAPFYSRDVLGSPVLFNEFSRWSHFIPGLFRVAPFYPRGIQASIIGTEGC